MNQGKEKKMNEKYWIEHEEKENLLREQKIEKSQGSTCIYSKSIFLRTINILIKFVMTGFLIYFIWMSPSIFLYLFFQSFNYVLGSEYSQFFDVLLKISYPTVNIIFVGILFLAFILTEINEENRKENL